MLEPTLSDIALLKLIRAYMALNFGKMVISTHFIDNSYLLSQSENL